MRRPRVSEFLDKLALLCAMLLFAFVGVRAIFEVRELDSIANQRRPLLSEMKVNAPRFEAEAPSGESATWLPPESQQRGEDWLFDVFTPPVIYYDPVSREFAVTPPNLKPEDNGEAQWAIFDVELLEVRLRPYRLQLVGYAGEAGSYVAYFENVETGQLVLLREGQAAPEAGVRLLGFQEQAIEVGGSEDATPVVQNVGVARLLDFNTEQEISLTNLETKLFSELEARVRVPSSGAVHVVKAGSRLELASGDYLIEDLSAQPQEAMVTKISKDGERRLSRTLTPRASNDLTPRSNHRLEAPAVPFATRTLRQSGKPKG